MHFYGDKLYIIGGYTYNEYSTNPSAATYSISVDEFENTKPLRIKTLNPKTPLVKKINSFLIAFLKTTALT